MKQLLQTVVDYGHRLSPAPGESQTIHAQVSAELMHNQQAAMPLAPNRAMRVVQDKAGRPMIFSIGTDQQLHLLHPQHGSATGWTPMPLSTQFTGYDAAVAFDLHQDSQGRISICLALRRRDGSGSDLFAASLLSNDRAEFDWTGFADKALALAGFPTGFVPEGIAVGGTEGALPPQVVVDGNLAGVKSYFQVLDFAAPAQALQFPEDVNQAANSLMGLSLGYVANHPVAFFLYKVGAGESLIAAPLDSSRSPYDYSSGNSHVPAPYQGARYLCMALGEHTGEGRRASDLYIASDAGIFLFRGSSERHFEAITDQLKDVQEMEIREDADSISIWARTGGDHLYYIAGTKGAPNTWNSPVLFSDQVVHLAPIRSKTRRANELFQVSPALEILHQWQDPDTTSWQSRTIKVGPQAGLVQFDSYSTQVSFKGKSGAPIAGQTMQVTASEWVYASINGGVYSLDKDHPVAVKTDGNGNLTIVTTAADASTPIFHVQSDRFVETLNIYPNQKVQQGLAAVNDGDALRAAKTTEGKPVLDPGMATATSDGIARYLGQMTSVSASMMPGLAPTTGLVLSAPGQKHLGLLSSAENASDWQLGLVVENGGFRAMNSSELAARPSLSIGSFFKSTAGDALHLLEKAFDAGLDDMIHNTLRLRDGSTFILKNIPGGLELTLFLKDQLGQNKLLKIALTTVVHVFKAINWLLKLAGIDLALLLKWLGFLFPWSDVWDTHKVLESLFRNGIKFLDGWVRKESQQLKVRMDQVLDQVAGQEVTLPPGVADKRPAAGSSNLPGLGGTGSVVDNWMGSQILHGGLLEGLDSTVQLSQSVQHMQAAVSGAVLDAFEQVFSGKSAAFAKLFTDPAASFQQVAQMSRETLLLILEPLKELLNAVLEVIPELLDQLAGVLQEDVVKIPFLSQMIGWVQKLLGINEKMDMVNAIAFMVAVPYTNLYKRMEGHAPFSSSHGLRNADLFYDLFSGNPIVPMLAQQKGGNGCDTDACKNYVKYGNWGATVVSFLANAVSLRDFQKKSKPDYEPINGEGEKKVELTTLDKTAAGLRLFKYVLTVPISGSNMAAHALRGIAYGVGIIYADGWWALKDYPKAKGFSLAATDLAILILAMTADGLEKKPPLVWTTDILSNLGGVVQGIGDGVESPRVQFAGRLGRAAGSLAGLAQTSINVEHQLGNVGG